MTNSGYFADRLNPQQLAAVEKVDGPLLILAGAGSGKTRVLTHRLANIVLQQKAAPDEILAVTFTNKAASEMAHRAEQILTGLGISIHDKLWVSTFHSTCVRILRQHAELLGYKRSFTIYDSGDQISLIKKISANKGLKEKEYPAKNFAYRIRWAKMEGKRPEDITKDDKFYMDKRTHEIYQIYEQEMFRANALDFDDLLMKTLLLLENFPKVLEGYQRRFRYIMVDEYQDTNHIQYKLLKLLANHHKNLCVVGDEDQSIYSWRGADISNILNFESDYDDAFVVKLEENYRSTQTIVDAASHVISKNTQRKGKTLFSNKAKGEKILIREEEDDRDEAKFVVKQINKIAKSTPYKDIAIFYRNNTQSRVLEEQLRTSGIPYKIIGGLRFYDRMEIKDALAYLRLMVNPNDDVAVKRIINVPGRGIGKTTIQKIEDISMERNRSMLESCHLLIEEKGVNAGTAKKIAGFLALIANLRIEAENYTASDLLGIILDETGYIKNLQKDDTPEAVARLENLEELSNAILQFEKDRKEAATLELFLEEMALISDQDSVNHSVDCVHLMTLHVSKGLEFPYVFIVGMEEGIFPSGQAVESGEQEEIEEERRLAYVGYTRAMDKLTLTHAKRRRMWGQTQFNSPSRFLDELPPEYVTMGLGSNRQPPKLNAIGSSFSSRANSASGFNSMANSGSSFSSHKSDDEFDFGNPNPWGDDEFNQETNPFEQAAPLEDWEKPKSGGGEYQKGMRVRHPQFGAGTIYEVKGSGEKAKLTVIFDGNFLKNFVAKFAKLTRV